MFVLLVIISVKLMYEVVLPVFFFFLFFNPFLDYLSYLLRLIFGCKKKKLWQFLHAVCSPM